MIGCRTPAKATVQIIDEDNERSDRLKFSWKGRTPTTHPDASLVPAIDLEAVLVGAVPAPVRCALPVAARAQTANLRIAALAHIRPRAHRLRSVSEPMI